MLRQPARLRRFLLGISQIDLTTPFRCVYRTLFRCERDGQVSLIRFKQPWFLLPCLAALIWYFFSATPATAVAATTLNGLLILSYIWARHIACHTSARRKLKYSAFQVYDELEEEILLENTGLLPILWAHFRDQSTLPGHDITSVRASTANNSITWSAKTICTRRGVFQLGPLLVSMGDPFNLFGVEQTYPHTEEVIVYPPLAQLPSDVLPQTTALGDQRKLRQALPAETINAFTTRPYIPGDPLRRLHWPRTAREGEPYVKIFEPESSGNIWLVPDFDAAVQLGEGDESTSEVLATLLAAISNRLLREHLAVGLFAWTDVQRIVLPRRGQPHHWNLLRGIAPLQPVTSRPLPLVVQAALGLTSARDLLIVVTPSLNIQWAQCPAQRSLMAILLDPAPFSGPAGAAQSALQLRARGIPTRILHRDEIKPIRAAYGPLSRWEFKVLSTGRVVVQQAPQQTPGMRPGARRSS
jgi:uncharacterized protein (DUF58 family)